MAEEAPDMMVQPPSEKELQLYEGLWAKPRRKRDPSPEGEASHGGQESKASKTDQGGKHQGQGRKGKGYNGKNKDVPQRGDHSQLINMMARLAIRHEDSWSLQRADHGFCLFLRTADSEETITKQLFQTSQTWKEHKAQNPQARRSPLRVVLFTMILQVLMERAKQVLEDAEARKKAVEDGKGSAMPSWVYLDYNPSEKKEVMDQNTPPLDQDRLMRRLKATQEHTHGEMILRFHGLRPLAMEMEGDQYLMVLEISQSSKEALQVLADLRDLTNNSIWKLIGARFRRDRIQAIGHAHSGNDQGTDIQLFMRIVLLNPSNRCYQNSLLMVLQWLRSMCGIILPSQLDDIMTQLTSHARIDVVNIPDWMRLLGTWAQPEAQHDAAEFMSYVLQATPIAGMAGMWNAFQGDRQTDESGPWPSLGCGMYNNALTRGIWMVKLEDISLSHLSF